jgi:hypothetical protein
MVTAPKFAYGRETEFPAVGPAGNAGVVGQLKVTARPAEEMKSSSATLKMRGRGTTFAIIRIKIDFEKTILSTANSGLFNRMDFTGER